MADLAGPIADRGARVEIDLPEDARVLATAADLRLLFQNLVSNAVKFADAVSPCARIDGELVVGVGWRIGVRDNGAGVSEADRERIFGAFERGAGPGAEGYGLGLAICERLVRRHGGALGLDPDDGEGARFWFVLPSATPVATAGSPPPASSPRIRPPP